MIYVKGRWPDGEIPTGEPEWFYYEVTEDTDVVCRTVEVFPDGRSIRNSIKLAEREGPDFREPKYRSLVHGSFLKLSEVREQLTNSTLGEFEKFWNNAVDKPWPD